ncbi:hypothetical protein BU16DRAFT_522749, partial [Lophium mytilinum]
MSTPSGRHHCTSTQTPLREECTKLTSATAVSIEPTLASARQLLRREAAQTIEQDRLPKRTQEMQHREHEKKAYYEARYRTLSMRNWNYRRNYDVAMREAREGKRVEKRVLIGLEAMGDTGAVKKKKKKVTVGKCTVRRSERLRLKLKEETGRA